MTSLLRKLNDDLIDEPPDLHSKCWLQGLAGWLMVIGLVYGIVFNCFSWARAYTHPFAKVNFEAFRDFGDFSDVGIKPIEYASLAAALLYVMAFAVLFRAVNSVSSAWRLLLVSFSSIALLTHAFGAWSLYNTAHSLVMMQEQKSAEIGRLIRNSSFNLTNVTSSLQSFACTWETGSCQLGSTRLLNSACYMGTATGQLVACPALALDRPNATGTFDGVLGQLCGPRSIFAANDGLLPEPSTHCVQCDAVAAQLGIFDADIVAAACGCLASVGDFFTIYGYNYFFTMFIIGVVGIFLIFSAIIVYLVVLSVMKSYGGWHFHEWFREASDVSELSGDF